MFGKWQPYPNHPLIQEMTRRLEDLQEQTMKALAAGDFPSAKRLLNERRAGREQLDELTEALLRDDSLVPRWVGHTEADAAAGGIPCLECGNNIPVGESCCSYCGWTYQADTPTVRKSCQEPF